MGELNTYSIQGRNIEFLETPRLNLLKFSAEDLDYIFKKFSKVDTMFILGLPDEESFEKEKLKSNGGYTTYDRTILHFKLQIKENNEVIGGAGFHNWYASHLRAELGYAISKESYKRQGYMTEAVKEILKYGFNDLNLNRIEACISPNNENSLKLIKKFGFQQEGYLRAHFIRNAEVEDSIIFSLLRSEYFEKRDAN